MINKHKIILITILTILIILSFTTLSVAQNNSNSNNESVLNNEENNNNDDKIEKLRIVLLSLDRQKLEEIANALEIDYKTENTKEELVEKILVELFENYEKNIDIINENINNNENTNNTNVNENNNQVFITKEILSNFHIRLGAGSHIPVVSVDNGLSQFYSFKFLLAMDYGCFFKFDDGGAVGIDFYMMFLNYNDYFDTDGFIHLSYMYEFSLKSQFSPLLFASIGVDFTTSFMGLGFKLGTQLSFAPTDSPIRIGLRIMLSMAYLTGKEYTDTYSIELKQKFLLSIPITLFFSFPISDFSVR